MKLTVYKGFDVAFLQKLDAKALIDGDCAEKKNVLLFDKKKRKQLDVALLSLEENDEAWVTYEEYALIKSRVDDAIAEDGLEVVICRNNLYPDYYPVEFDITPELAKEIMDTVGGEQNPSQSEECRKFLVVYSTLIDADGVLYAGFYNYEYNNSSVLIQDYYPQNITIEESDETPEAEIFLNEDVDTYLRDFGQIASLHPGVISLKSTNGELAARTQKALQAYCVHNGIRIIYHTEKLPEDLSLEMEMADIAKNVIKINNFTEFRSIRFYKDPDVSNETIELSQSQIMQEIIRQAEKSYNETNGHGFRDIFITASTGAGKSVMFQIPAVYLAKKYQRLTIIIEPVKALMQDQKDKLNKAGYTRVEAFNSDLITQVEKEKVLNRIKDGEVDLLYLSPETLLSYSIETIIGDREIGLLIVDEAHIVTTWGVGFRPDYWYLGSYLNRLRNQIQTARGMKRKTYHFPICAFTATAINGGVDDSVGDTIISLYMENPIKYFGYVRRDDIGFEIKHHASGEKLPKSDYEAQKCKVLDQRIKDWLKKKEKTIVYFPYATLVKEASNRIKGVSGNTVDQRIGTYTGRNINELSNEMFAETKRQTFEDFRTGKTPVMMATKAFGMGIDVNDVVNVYHYAVSGNLSDYVQEVGRAARDKALTGKAIVDFFANDMTYMKVLFGMSQIRQYQIKKVLAGIYDTYKSKKESRNFLISPESFTYIFNGKNEGDCINRLKTCLLMLEKDFYDKYNFKVLISRPQSVFTKAYICIPKESEKTVLNSKYGKYMAFEAKGRVAELQKDGGVKQDTGDIYTIDLKSIWEEYHPNISFPQFKYWYFNNDPSKSKNNVEIMPSIRNLISPRQKVSIEARHDYILSEIREKILQDFDFIVDKLYSTFGKQYFTTTDFINLISPQYGATKARIIANTIFDLVDLEGKCVKRRHNDTSVGNSYSLANGNFKEYLRKPINKAKIMQRIQQAGDSATYVGYMSLITEGNSNTALKLLSVFDYITYEVSGGEEPEIFIRLNDPNKIRDIVLGNIKYTNSYASKAKQKHDRDVKVLIRFFNDLKTDNERWNYIEDYFLGQDVLVESDDVSESTEIKMSSSVDKEKSYPTNSFRGWDDLKMFFDESDHSILMKLKEMGLPIPEFLQTKIKKSDEGKDILMSWPSKDTLICRQDTSDDTIEDFKKKGWKAYRIYEIDYDSIKEALN